MPQVIVLARPNGAGKTTFASEYLPDRAPPLRFVNADEIAREASLIWDSLEGDFVLAERWDS
jgi:predicted ABC-type ATPase